MNRYEERQERKREGLRAAAQKRRGLSASLEESGRKALDAIPFGQPILIGHHSEKSDRAYRGRAVGKIDRAYAIAAEADELEQRADRVGTGGVSSDDPDAVSKLLIQVEKAEELQARFKAINAAHAAFLKDPASLDAVEFSDEEKQMIRTYVPKYSWLKHPIARYQIANNAANIRRLKKRIEELQARQNQPAAAPVVGKGWSMTEDLEDNRIIVRFDERQSEEVTKMLRSRAFLWSPSRKAWVRKITGNARLAARQLAEQLAGL